MGAFSKCPAYLVDSQCVLAVVLASPWCLWRLRRDQRLDGGSYLPRAMQSSGTRKGGKPDSKSTFGDGTRASRTKLTLDPALGHPDVGALGGLSLASAWRTVIGSGCVGGWGFGGGGQCQAGDGAGLWSWVGVRSSDL